MATILKDGYDSSRFTYVAATRSLVAEISDFGRTDPFKRIYDDACDVGLAIRSVRTGAVVRYYLEREELNADDEIVAWHLKPIAEDARRAAGTEVVLFND